MAQWGKNLPARAGDVSSILGWQDHLEEEMAKSTPVFLHGNPMDWGACRATVHGNKVKTWLSH